MAHAVIRSYRARRLVMTALSASAACIPGVAWAQCVANGPPVTTISCTGSAPAYSNTTATGVAVSVASGATVSAPLVIGTASAATGNVLNNSGTIAGTGTAFTVQFGDGATINNGAAASGSTAAVTTASITSTGASAGAGAILLGNNGTVNNYGTLTATAGTPAIQFGANGTFNNEAVAPVAVSGNIVFTQGGGTFNNYNTAFGLTGSVTQVAGGTVNNQGLWTGNFTESTVGNTNLVTVTNGTSSGSQTGITYTGVLATQDVTNLTNYGTMYLYEGSGIGSAVTSGTASAVNDGTSQVINNGTLYIGTGISPALININGNFSQGPNGTLNMIVLPAGASVATAGTTFSQLNAVGGSMSLGGTLALNITPGYYTTTGAASVYKLLVADDGITGQFSSVTGGNLPFISFTPVNCGVGGNTCTPGTIKTTTTTVTTAATSTTPAVTTTTTVTAPANAVLGTTTTTSGTTTTTVTTTATSTLSDLGTAGIVTTSGTQQAYEFQVTRNGTYHDALASGLALNGISTTSRTSANELAIAKGLMPNGINSGLVATANAAVAANNLTDDSITFVGQIDVLTIAQAQAFLDSVSPEGYLAYKTALHDQANAFTRSIALRMDDQNSDHDEDGWWFNTQGEYEMDSRADTTNGYRTRDNLLGFVAGYDFSGPHHVYGLALNLSWDALSYAPGSMNGHNRDIALAGYGAYDLGPLVLSGQLAYNMGHLGANKTITLGEITRSAHASAGEHLLKVTGNVGLNLVTGDFKVQPFVGIEYANGAVSGFTETAAAGTSASDLTVAGMNATRTDLMAGINLTRSTGAFRPYIRVAYRNQIGSGNGNVVTAYFNADPTTTFSVTGVGEARHEIDANAGVNWVFDDAGSLFAGVQATTRTAHTSVGANIGVRLEF